MIVHTLLLVLYLSLLIFDRIGHAVKVGDLDFPLGKEEGVNSTSSVSSENLQKILAGVEKGNRENIYFYGLLKLYGIAVSLDIPGAAQQFRRASDLGHKEAATAYGVMMLSGATGTKDETEAIKFFKEGVKREDKNAFWLSGMLLMNRGQYSEALVYLHRAVDWHGMTEIHRSGYSLRQATERPYHPDPTHYEPVPQALHLLALLYEYGRGVQTDINKAIHYYSQASEFLQTESLYHLGLLYASGRGGSQANYGLARAQFETAARYNHAPSIYYIAIFKTYGYGCAVDYEQAIRWFERAAALNDDRVKEKARAAAIELKGLVERAYRENEATLDLLQARTMQQR